MQIIWKFENFERKKSFLKLDLNCATGRNSLEEKEKGKTFRRKYKRREQTVDESEKERKKVR